MKPWLKHLKWAFVANALMILLYVYFNYFVWAEFNNGGLIYSWWNPFWIQISHAGSLINGQFIPTMGLTMFPNYFFIWYFVTTAINLFFMVKLQRSNETKQTT